MRPSGYAPRARNRCNSLIYKHSSSYTILAAWKNNAADWENPRATGKP